MYVIIDTAWFAVRDGLVSIDQDWRGAETPIRANRTFDRMCRDWEEFDGSNLIGWRVDLVEVPTDRWWAIDADVELWLWDDIGSMRSIDRRVGVRDGVYRHVILPYSIAVDEAIAALAPEVAS